MGMGEGLSSCVESCIEVHRGVACVKGCVCRSMQGDSNKEDVGRVRASRM